MSFSFRQFLVNLFPERALRVEGIQSQDVFAAILTHERAVADRDSNYFSLLAFNTTRNHLSHDSLHALGKVFADRLRTSDLAGWLDSTTIGVLLPYTRFKDATTVARHICHRMTLHGTDLAYKIYLYPLDRKNDPSVQQDLPWAQPLDDGQSTGAGAIPRGSLPYGMSASPPTPDPLEDLCAPNLPVWKRLLDIVLSLAGIIIAGPLMLMIVAGIKIVSPGPVLFRQERVGFMGRRFVLLKFRSMRINADTGTHQEYLAQLMHSNTRMAKLDATDTRLIPLGKLFRASGLDELPQLFNILRGDMSLIGPRPSIPYEYDSFAHWHKRRCDVMPGLTGLWQVSGKNKTTFTEMMRLDLSYAHHRSLMTDIKILFRTVPTVIGQIKDNSASRRP